MPRTKFKPDHQVAYDRVPLQFKVSLGVRDKLKAVPDWQQRLRDFVDELIATQTSKDG
jgi:hypothetical protein